MAGERSTAVRHEPGEAPARISVGDVLRHERERRAFSLDDVAANLRIRRALLDAIEEGRFKELPGAPYAAGFVKTYAEFLELDRDEILRRFKEEAAGLDSHKELHFPRPLSESRLPGGVLLLLSAVIAASAYALWYFQNASDRAALPRVAAVPERLVPLAETPQPLQPQPQESPSVESAAQAPAATGPAPALTSEPAPATDAQSSAIPSAEPAAPAVPVPADASAASARPAEPVAAPLAAPAAVPAAPTAAPVQTETAAIPAPPGEVSAQPRAYGESESSRIVIRATSDSWIQVRDPSGAVVFTRVLRSGDSYNVPNREGLFLYTGSAGALEINVDGKVVPSIGQFGAVRRDVMLDPDRLTAGTAVLDQRRSGTGDGTNRPPAARTGQAGPGTSDISRP